MSVEREEPAVVHLIVMSRAPVAGQTKTRLTPRLSAEQARDFHAACLLDMLDGAVAWRAQREGAGAPTRLHLFITPPGSQADFHAAGVAWPPEFTVRDQVGESLGRRMDHALATVFSESVRPAWVLLVGSDLPLLGAPHFDEALGALRSADVVFGPTLDGGYYLVALKAPPLGIFDTPKWGTRTVLEDTLLAANAYGQRTALISALPDADVIDDLRAIRDHSLTKHLAQSRSLRFIEGLFSQADGVEDSAGGTRD